MKTTGSYLVNDKERPVRFGEVDLINPPRRERRGLPLREGKPCRTVLTGFCGTDWELMRMGAEGRLGPKFPEGQERLINGHEGVVWVPDESRYAIVLIRGGDAFDPSRFEADETYFEYGCDGADGLMARQCYIHPDMLLQIPAEHLPPGSKITRRLANRLVFSDPMACVLFQRERLEDLLVGHNRRLYEARGMDRSAATDEALRDGFARVLVYGLGTTGLLATIAIKEKYRRARVAAVDLSEPGGKKDRFLAERYADFTYLQARTDPAETAREIVRALDGRPKVVLGTSGSEAEAQIAFAHGVLDNNGIYASFSLGPVVRYDSMPFGFRNQLIYGAINFRRDHMEDAIRLLAGLPVDRLVREHPLEALAQDPVGFYHEVYRSPGRAVKSVCVWDEERIE
jgi:threonine dehydrogenase-like Zn-dependent dehydrogenase